MEGIKNFIKRTDWILLIFLFLVANHAMFALKVLGVVFIYILRPNFKFGFFKGRIPQFYLYIVLLAIINLFVHVREFSYEYLVAFTVGNSFWIAGLLIHHQLRLSIEKNGDEMVFNTMKAFILCNLGFNLYQLAKIAVITHTFNPYVDLPFPYGMSTGDRIFGFFMENSYYNMMVSAMVAVYFLFKRNFVFTLISAICMLMVYGNVGTLVFTAVLLGVVVASLFRSKEQNGTGFIKRFFNNISVPRRRLFIVPVLIAVSAFFYLVISFSNGIYLYEKLGGEVDKAKLGLVAQPAGPPPAGPATAVETGINPEDSIVSRAKNALHELEGKQLSYEQTINYLKSSPSAFLLGAGTTRFSSVTAQRMSGLDSSRIFLKILPQYMSPLYRDNHRLLVVLRLHSAEAEMSNANWPDSFYNQIFGEYGVLGFILFLVFYVGFFLKDIKYWTYSFWLSIMLFPFALISYMFEPLCAMVFFEFLVVADILNNKKQANAG